MENKHTPEWYISKMKSPVYGSDGSLVDERYGIGSGPSTFIGSVKKLEHARLIAAAPEMLEALKEILADQEPLNEPYRNEAICERIRAAIAKAEGK